MISLIHIILLTSIALFVYFYSRHIFFIDDIFGKFNDTLKYAGTVIAYYAILLESFLKRRHQTKIWNLLIKYHGSGLDTIDQNKLWNSRQYNKFFYGYFLVVVLVEIYRMPFVFKKSHTLNFWLLHMILVIVTRSRHMQFMFYINTLHRQINLLCEELQQISEYSNYPRTKLSPSSKDAYNRFLYHRLLKAREYYSLIFEIANNINDAFGWSHLANLIHSFTQILTEIYWIYWNTDNNQEELLGDSIVIVIPSIAIVVLVFRCTTKLHMKAKKAAFFVHNMTGNCPRFLNLIESFSLQLLHEPIIFRAQGCFNLDFSILRDMLTAITTYMVFFIQFTPQYKSDI